MKIFFLLFLFFGTYHLTSGQQASLDSAANLHQKQLAIYNQQYPDLKDDSLINQLNAQLNTQTTSIIGCFMLLEVGGKNYLNLSSSQKEAILNRLKEIANRLVDQGTPIIIYGSFMSSVAQTISMNAQPNAYNLIYITQGDSCTHYPGSLEGEGIKAFNQVTKNRLGPEAFPIPDIPDKKNKKSKKRIRA